MSEFTPGPWKAQGMGSEGYNIYTEEPGKTLREKKFRGAIAEVRSGEWEVLRANAHLIAAAPELYEACKRALQFIINGREYGYIQTPEPETNDAALETPNIIRKALAKAEGKARAD